MLSVKRICFAVFKAVVRGYLKWMLALCFFLFPTMSSHFAQLLQLEEVSQLIEKQLTHDEQYPDIWDLITCSCHSGNIVDYRLESTQFEQSRIVVLPKPLLEQYDSVECKSFMGLFPEISRAWITFDNQIFLWNYADGADFCYYEVEFFC